MNHTLTEHLTDPAAYPHPAPTVEYLQTHISHIFLAGEHAYKIKKPVDLGFLDYRDIDDRRHFCEEEVVLNRRMAPDVYLGVVPIIRTSEGRLRVDGTDDDPRRDIVDYAVHMRRLPANRMLSALLAAGDLDNQRIRDLARLLVDFHALARTGQGVDQYGTPASIRHNCEENFEQTEPFTGGPKTVSPLLHGFLRRRATEFLDTHHELLEDRVAAGRIREGHGDLHAGNICVLEDRIVAYDCIEFSPRFRCSDVTSDLAFLLMDLDLNGFRGFSDYLLREYVTRSGDRQIEQLTPFYKGYRAFVRGKVTSMQLAGLDGRVHAEKRAEAMSYFHLAASYDLPPPVILCCGLPGSGKSWTAEHLAQPFEAAILNSDTTRKRLTGVAPDDHTHVAIDRGLYSADISARTYTELLRHTEELLRQGRTVVVDAGFRRRTDRAPFYDLASQHKRPVVLVHVDTAESVARRRLEKRRLEPDAVSDAGTEVYTALAKTFEAPIETAPESLVTSDGVSPVEDVTSAAIDCIVRARPA